MHGCNFNNATECNQEITDCYGNNNKFIYAVKFIMDKVKENQIARAINELSSASFSGKDSAALSSFVEDYFLSPDDSSSKCEYV